MYRFGLYRILATYYQLLETIFTGAASYIRENFLDNHFQLCYRIRASRSGEVCPNAENRNLSARRVNGGGA